MHSRREVIAEVLHLVEEMESLQRAKVTTLARRLLPTLTSEDLRNPHDFPELDDNDWHFEDGQLAGMQAVLAALRAEHQRAMREPVPARGETRGDA